MGELRRSLGLGSLTFYGAGLIVVVITTLLYVLVAAASVALVEPAKLAESASPLADAMGVGAPQLAGALGGVALFATANTALITITATSRLLARLLGRTRPVPDQRRPDRRTTRGARPIARVVLVSVHAATIRRGWTSQGQALRWLVQAAHASALFGP